MKSHNLNKRAFTLIELSIVLVIIGLIVGGILVGRDLINSAAIRSQIAQIDSYNSAVNTFKVKYNYLPGDIPDPDATRFGFVPRVPPSNISNGNGNGLVEGGISLSMAYLYLAGENLVFWRDLSQIRLVDGSFNTAASGIAPDVGATGVSLYLPKGKIGSDNYIGVSNTSLNNYFFIDKITSISSSASAPQLGLSVSQAANIDKKVDDGKPGTGNVLAAYFTASIAFAGFENTKIWVDGISGDTLSTTATAGSSTSCVDNANVAGAQMNYSITQNKGSGMNCSLVLKIQ